MTVVYVQLTMEQYEKFFRAENWNVKSKQTELTFAMF